MTQAGISLRYDDKGAELRYSQTHMSYGRSMFKSRYFSSTSGIMAAMKKRLQDVIRQVMEIGNGLAGSSVSALMQEPSSQLPKRLLSKKHQDPAWGNQ